MNVRNVIDLTGWQDSWWFADFRWWVTPKWRHPQVERNVPGIERLWNDQISMDWFKGKFTGNHVFFFTIKYGVFLQISPYTNPLKNRCSCLNGKCWAPWVLGMWLMWAQVALVPPVGMFVDLPTSITLYTLWLFNIAMENGPFIDDVPSYKPPFIRDFPWLC